MRQLLEKHVPQQATATSSRRVNRGYDAHEIDELLDLATRARPMAPTTTAATPVLVAALPSANDDAGHAPKSRNDIFKRYAAYEAAISAASAAQASAEREAFGYSLTSRPRTDGIEEIAKNAISMMVHEAQKQFSNRYTSLSIRTSDVLAATGQENWQQALQQVPSRLHRGMQPPPVVTRPEVPVDLDKIWTYLEKTYGGEAGQIALYKQLAPLLINRLHLNDKDMRRTASAVIAYQNIRSTTASFGAKTGPYKLYERSDVNVVFDALSHVFEWAGQDALSLALKPDRHKIGDYEFKFDSREKFCFPGLDIVFFKDSIDWKFGHEAAAKLQLFLGEFGI
jgi:cell division septum initiation protein DivIVA